MLKLLAENLKLKNDQYQAQISAQNSINQMLQKQASDLQNENEQIRKDTSAEIESLCDEVKILKEANATLTQQRDSFKKE